MAREIKTVYDANEALTDMLGNATTGVPLRGIRRAMQSAVREVLAATKSPYMQKKGRIVLKAPQTSSTVTYDHTGGAYERMVTLASGTWPSFWVKDASIYFDGVICDVEDYKTSTVITLDVNLNPGADVAAGASYVLFPRYYPLPDDFDDTEGVYGENLIRVGHEITMEDYLRLNRWDCGVGTPNFYAIGGVQDLIGSMGLFIWPPADAADTIDFLYKRKAREIRYTGCDTADTDYASSGTISVATGSTAVTGTSTNFNSKMVGSILLIGDSTNNPTGLSGLYPYVDQRVIHAVTDTTHLTIDRAPSVTNATAKYRITDFIDIDPICYDAFLMRCFLDLAVQRDMSQVNEFRAMYQEALHLAKMAMSRANQPQQAMTAPSLLERRFVQGDYTQITEFLDNYDVP